MSHPRYDNSALARTSFRNLCDEITATGSSAVGAYSSLKILLDGMKAKPVEQPVSRCLTFTGAAGKGDGSNAGNAQLTGGLPPGLFEPLPEGGTPGSQLSVADSGSVSDVGDLDLDLMLEESHDISSSESMFGDTAADPTGYSQPHSGHGAAAGGSEEGDGSGDGARGAANQNVDEETAKNDRVSDDGDYDEPPPQEDDGNDGDATEEGGGQEESAEEGDNTTDDDDIDHGDLECSPGVTAVREDDDIGTFLITCADDADLRISARIHTIAANAGDTVHSGLRRYAISDADMHHRLASAIHAYAQVIVNWYAGGAAGMATPFRYAVNIKRLTSLEPKDQIAAVSRPYRPALKYAIKYYMDYLRVLDYKRSKECIIHAIDNGYKAAYNSRLYARKSAAREAAKAARDAANAGNDGGDDTDGEPVLEAFPAI